MLAGHKCFALDALTVWEKAILLVHFRDILINRERPFPITGYVDDYCKSNASVFIDSLLTQESFILNMGLLA